MINAWRIYSQIEVDCRGTYQNMTIHVYQSYLKPRPKINQNRPLRFIYSKKIRLNVVVPSNVQHIQCIYDFDGRDYFKMSTSPNYYPSINESHEARTFSSTLSQISYDEIRSKSSLFMLLLRFSLLEMR